MYVGLSFELGLEQKLTPQQVQYLKLLQLTGLQLEQHIGQELEINPMLEEGISETQEIAEETDLPNEADPLEMDDREGTEVASELTSLDEYKPENADGTNEETWQDYIEDEGNPSRHTNDDDHNGEPIPIQSVTTFIEDLLEQVRMLNLPEEDDIVAEEILWSVESNGYLLRDVDDIVVSVNEKIDVLNRKEICDACGVPFTENTPTVLPQEQHNSNGVSPQAPQTLQISDTPPAAPVLKPKAVADSRWMVYDDTEDFTDHIDVSFAARAVPTAIVAEPQQTPATSETLTAPEGMVLLQHVTREIVEEVLMQVQTLDPPGIGARNLQECLLAQLRALPKLNAAQQLAQQVLLKCYDSFKMKHYEVIMKELKVTNDYLREAIQAIRALNPKPGGGDSSAGTGSIIPDFFIHFDEEKTDFIIQLNDSRVPNIRVNKMYEQMKSQVREIAKKGVKSQKMNKDAKKFFKQKYDDAKFLIQALRQRRQTMIRVMAAIVHRQREFFLRGEDFLRPLIYKNIAEDTGVDISTVCRVVNNKYTQTDYGIFELRYFFSEGLPIPKAVLDGLQSSSNGVKNGASSGTATNGTGSHEDDAGGDGEMDEVSTRIVKNKLKELIEHESKLKPLSDDKLAQELNKLGYNIARRTVAKYRDLMNIAPARLRREL